MSEFDHGVPLTADERGRLLDEMQRSLRGFGCIEPGTVVTFGPFNKPPYVMTGEEFFDDPDTDGVRTDGFE